MVPQQALPQDAKRPLLPPQSGGDADTTVLQQSSGKARRKTPLQSDGKARYKWLQRYWGSMVRISVAFPIFASAATVCIYLAPHFPFLDFLHLDQSNWYAPIYGFLFTCIVLLFSAVLYSYFATARRANTHVYGMLTRYYSELQAHLGEPDQPKGKICPQEVLDAFGIEKDKPAPAALREAHEAFYDLHVHLFSNDSGVEWTLGTGYIHAWRMIHRIQEALMEVDRPEKVIGYALHDVRAIQNSQIHDSNVLTGELLRAVKALAPGAMGYFEELSLNKNFADIFSFKKADKDNVNPLDVEESEKGNASPPDVEKSDQTSANPLDAVYDAREVLRQVKHALNTYQDGLRSSLVRVRNYLSASIAVTGLVTHLLLCLVILLDTTRNPGSINDVYRLAIVSAAAYYIIGAVAGLFGHFYNEANSDSAPDDYGLFLSRLIARPLLSGLAGIGGVLFTTSVLNHLPALGTVFDGTPTMEDLLAAAAFGFAPSLIMASLQQRTQKYATDLQNTKGETSKRN